MKCSYQQVKQSVNIDSMTRMSSVCERERERENTEKLNFVFSSLRFLLHIENIIPVRIVSTTTRVFIAHRAYIRRYCR